MDLSLLEVSLSEDDSESLEDELSSELLLEDDDEPLCLLLTGEGLPCFIGNTSAAAAFAAAMGERGTAPALLAGS